MPFYCFFFPCRILSQQRNSVCNVAFLTPLEASLQPFCSSLSEATELGHVRAGPWVPGLQAAKLPACPSDCWAQELTARAQSVARRISVWLPR